MNLRYSIRRSTFQNVLRAVAQRTFASTVPAVAVPTVGISWQTTLRRILGDEVYRAATEAITSGFVVATIVDDVRILEDGPDRTPPILRRDDPVPYFPNVQVVFHISLFASQSVDAASVNTGGVPPSMPIRFRIHYLMSLQQPGPASPPAPAPSTIPPGPAQSSLALLLNPAANTMQISVAGSPYLSASDLAPTFQSSPPPWMSALNRALATLYVGGLLPPMNLTSLMALSAMNATPLPDGAARIAFDTPALVRGDEVQFGIVLTNQTFLRGVPVPQLLPIAVRNEAIASFLRGDPMLAAAEECAVELGRDAFGCFCYPFLSSAETSFLASLSATSERISTEVGSPVRIRRMYASPAPMVTAPDGAISIAMRFDLDGACVIPHVDFSSDLSIGLDVKITARARVVDIGFIAMYVDLAIEADFNLADLSACAVEMILEDWLVGLFLAPAYLRTMDVQDQRLEGQIAAQIVGAFQTLQPDPAPTGRFLPFADGSRAYRQGTDNVLISFPIPVRLDAIGNFPFDPNSIHSVISGRTYRIAGSLLEFDSAGASSTAVPTVEVIADEFVMSFERGCVATRYSSLAFSVRSTRSNLRITQIEVISPAWRSLFENRLLRWVPSPDASPVSVLDGRSVIFRCEFTATAAVDVALGRLRAPENWDLVVLVRSNQLPVVVRWPDPLRRLRELTPADIERVRDVCLQGPISQPSEIHRRPTELELVTEIQPFWGGEFTRSGGGLPTPVNPQLPPWESEVPRPDLRLDANPGVFALLMQSVSQQR